MRPLIVLLFLAGCGVPPPPPDSEPSDEPTERAYRAPDLEPWFSDATNESGVETEKRGGLAIYDADGDGFLDLHFFEADDARLYLNRTRPARSGFRFKAGQRRDLGSPLMNSSVPEAECGEHERLVADFDHDANEDAIVLGKSGLELLAGNEDGTWDGVDPGRAGDPFRGPFIGRGLYAGDLDNDGDLDLVLTQEGASARIFENRTRSGRAIVLRGLAHGCRVNINYGPVEVTKFFRVHAPTVTDRGHGADELHLTFGDYERMGVEEFWMEGFAINSPDGTFAGSWMGLPGTVMHFEFGAEGRYELLANQ